MSTLGTDTIDALVISGKTVGGLTKREYFAATALAAICARPLFGQQTAALNVTIATIATQQADALIAALNTPAAVPIPVSASS